MQYIYLDHNATTPLRPEVKETITNSLDLYGNASSYHPLGIKARESIENARSGILAFLGADEGRLIFTSNGSESNNLVLKGLVCEGSICPRHKTARKRPHVITTQIEHPSVINTVSCLNRIGAEVTLLDVDQYGLVDPDEIKRALRPSTVLVSIMHGNNEIGTIQPIGNIGSYLQNEGITFHTDAVQTVGKIPVDVNKLNVDYLSLSGHKINAPKGIGALFIRRIMTLCPLIHGGHQEQNLRAGTENTIGIIAMGKAIELIKLEGETAIQETQRLRDRLYENLSQNLTGVHLNGHPTRRLPGTLNVSFDRIDGAALLEMMAIEGIAASTGSACSTGDSKPSHVLTALGLPPERIRSAIRFSLGYGNTETEIDTAGEKIIQMVSRLRKISPI
ncbi:cysteine desulfurase [bacterium]|nr:cysteine desulfurase [candidate division CSSED10-310 bacterium]